MGEKVFMTTNRILDTRTVLALQVVCTTQQEDVRHNMSCWYICGLLSEASLCRIKEEKTLATGENILIAVCTCKFCRRGKGSGSMEHLNISPVER